MGRTFFIALLLIICTVCHEKENDEKNNEEVIFLKPPIDCAKESSVLDSLNTAKALIGEWEWKYASCGWRDPSMKFLKDCL